jgi:DtxR family transcriptional regulator, Mn-dependent transcriptional regulator
LNYTTSEENYLKAIYHLQEVEGSVSTTVLADRLRTRAASVTDMMKKLSAKNLLNYKPYYGFSLSDEGEKIALDIVRRHRLWEYFLSEKLKFGWSEVHALAEELEHVSSKTLTDRLDEYLGFPSFDPHGDPIPDAEGSIKHLEKLAVADLPIRKSGRVVQVTNQSAEMLEVLLHKQIRIGTRLEVRRVFQFDGSVEIKVKNSLITLSEQLAKNVFVAYESPTS